MNHVTLLLASFVFFFGIGTLRADEDILPRLSRKYENIRIVRVVKSDLVELENGKKVRLIGLKALDEPRRREYDVERDQYGFVVEHTPEPTTPVEEQAAMFARELMDQKKVRVEFDVQALDEQGHNWGYVFLSDGAMANAEILRQGFAELQIRPPNLKYAEQLRESYRESRQEKRGIQAE